MKFKGEAFVFISATGFALMPVFAKLAYKLGVNVSTVLFFRFLIAISIIWAYIFIKRIDFRIKLRQAFILMILGSVLYAGSSISIFSSYKFISAGFSEVLLFTYPAMVLIVSVIFLKEKIEVNKVYAVVLSIMGTVLVAYTPGQIINFKGIAFALLGALFYAIYVIVIGHGKFEGVSPVVMSGYVIFFAFVTFTIFAFLEGGITVNFNVNAWICITLMALFSTSIAIFAFCFGAKTIGSSAAAIISGVEPVEAIVFGYIFLKESLNPIMVIGALIVVMAIVSIYIFEPYEKVNVNI
ncbi:DMT family transporter [Caloramator sp. E03]|uniref:DMT family transporter n=1 Tax=Caloramator sp. E03 TaxID=2576307 RepID=UPI001110838D|nr:DMT family transporter [Caloramator sp. E03]QCX34207.1 DMT family transporter [Caloramator sp. E03]